jgi:hypothetical protein
VKDEGKNAQKTFFHGSRGARGALWLVAPSAGYIPTPPYMYRLNPKEDIPLKSFSISFGLVVLFV